MIEGFAALKWKLQSCLSAQGTWTDRGCKCCSQSLHYTIDSSPLSAMYCHEMPKTGKCQLWHHTPYFPRLTPKLNPKGVDTHPHPAPQN